MRPRLELYPFKYIDPVTGKWVRARYLAERHEIAERYVEWEIGQAEARDVEAEAPYFNSESGPALSRAGFAETSTAAADGQSASASANAERAVALVVIDDLERFSG